MRRGEQAQQIEGEIAKPGIKLRERRRQATCVDPHSRENAVKQALIPQASYIQLRSEHNNKQNTTLREAKQYLLTSKTENSTLLLKARL